RELAARPRVPVPAPSLAPTRAAVCASLQDCAEECIAKIAASCAQAGRFSESPTAGADNTRAVGFSTQACEGGVAAACRLAGRIEEDGRGVARSYGDAQRVYTTGCGLEDAEACGRLGWFYVRGLGVRANLVRAAEYFRKACERGDAAGCHGLGTLYAKGDP